MNKNQLMKFVCVLMLSVISFSLAACCCSSDQGPTIAECNATLDKNVKDFEDSFAGASISIEKSADVKTFSAVGQVINYTYTISNISPKDFNILEVQDDKIVVSCPTAESLTANQSLTCTGSHTVTEEDISVGAISNTASAEATAKKEFTCIPGGGTTIKRQASYTAQASTSLTILLDVRPELSLTKSVDNEFYSGGQWVTYTYTLTNTGNVPLSQPFSIDDDKVPDGWSCDPQDELQPGSSMSCYADYLIDAGLRWTITNTAVACGYYEEQQVCSESASASVLFRQPIVLPKPPEPPKPPPAPYCGDGIVQPPEFCDPPNGFDCGNSCQGL